MGTVGTVRCGLGDVALRSAVSRGLMGEAVHRRFDPRLTERVSFRAAWVFSASAFLAGGVCVLLGFAEMSVWPMFWRVMGAVILLQGILFAWPRTTHLRLDSVGFSLRYLGFRRVRARWAEVESLELDRRTIKLRFAGGPRDRREARCRKRNGVDAVVTGDVFAGLKPPDVHLLLCLWRNHFQPTWLERVLNEPVAAPVVP